MSLAYVWGSGVYSLFGKLKKNGRKCSKGHAS